MIAVCSRDEIRLADSKTMQHEPISSLDLMERAALQVTLHLLAQYPGANSFVLVCGNGNNGGDGMCIARLLLLSGMQVCVVLAEPAPATDAFVVNRSRYKGSLLLWNSTTPEPVRHAFERSHVLIDALFGTGINRPVEGSEAALINLMNAAQRPVVSVDVPSGLRPDSDETNGAIVKADATIGFDFYKQNILYPETGPYYGTYFPVPIGLASSLSDHTKYMLTAASFKNSFPVRDLYTHKGSYGTMLLYGGWQNLSGAALLCAKSALRCGAGKVNWVMDEPGYEHLSFVPELITSQHREAPLHRRQGISAVVAGPGFGKTEEAAGALKLILQDWRGPLVLDADAINMLAENPTWLSWLPEHTILTPHPAEFDRLTGRRNTRKEALALASDFAKKYRVYVLLKGHYSALATPGGRLWFCGTGNPALAKAGTGDVLSGIIGALVTRGFHPAFAAAFGMTFHGFLADEWVKTRHEDTLLASDLIESIPGKLRQFINTKSEKIA